MNEKLLGDSAQKVEEKARYGLTMVFLGSKALTLALAAFINAYPRYATGKAFHMVKNALVPAYIFYKTGHKEQVIKSLNLQHSLMFKFLVLKEI